MNRHSLFAGALIALGAVACTDDRTPEPTSPSSLAGLTGATCKYSDVKKYARDLFGSRSAGYTLAQQMSSFAKDSPEATEIAFQIFAAIAAKRDAASDFSAFIADAANLTVQTINCANVTSTGAISVTVFSQALASTGGYGVPSSGAGSIVAKDGQASVNSPAAGFGSWLGNPSEALFYGFIPVATPGNPIPTPGESQAGFTGRKVYDWSLLRRVGAPALNGKGSVSLCVAYETEDPVDPTQFRIQKLSNILQVQTPQGTNCDLSLLQVTTSSAPTGFFARLLNQTGGWLSPEPLHAAFGKLTTSPTGSAGNFSLFFVGDPVATQVSFLVPPIDGTLNGGIPGEGGQPVTVLVKGDGNTPWEDVKTRIYGLTNNGAKEPFEGACISTNASGKSEFPNLKAPKTGGYLIFVETGSQVSCDVDPDGDPDVEGFDAVTVQAPNRINVRPDN